MRFQYRMGSNAVCTPPFFQLLLLSTYLWSGLIQLEKKVSEQAARIHELELLSPGEDGDYKLLKQELKDLEKASSA